jgi:hypothetical protein
MIVIRNRLSAGFFSNLNAVIGWYWYSMNTNTPVYIHWDGIEQQNIFNYFFEQKYKYHSHGHIDFGFLQFSPLFTEELKYKFKKEIGENFYNKYENGWYLCKGQIYWDEEFHKVRGMHNHVYNENLKIRSNKIPIIKVPSNTLGINYRFIDMYSDVDDKRTPFKEKMSLEEYNQKYLNEIEKKFEEKNYDKIYLASSQQVFFDACLNKFKDKILYLPMKRLDEGLWQHYRGTSYEEEYTNVLSDVFNLSQCDELLASPSNILFGLLYMFPNINFEIFSFLKNTHTQ